jgi:predicted Fe-Mo cluster-binding NifX family protein
MTDASSATAAAPTASVSTAIKVAVPSDSDQGLASTRSGHFGRSPYFTVATVENGFVRAVEVVKNVDHDATGCGGVIRHVQTLGIDALVVRGMGRPPFTALTNAGVTVYIDGAAPTVADVLDRFVAGALPRMTLDQACVH